MAGSQTKVGRVGGTRRAFDFATRVKEIDMFFQGDDPVHQTMQRVTEKLDAAKIPYALIGGMAVNAHRYERTTRDVDFLLTDDGFNAFRRTVMGEEFEPVPGRPRRFRDRRTGISIDILVTGLFPGSGQPGPIAFPDPASVSEIINNRQVVNLPTLIQLKLAARRHKDFGDVVELIRVHNLDEAFLDKLHTAVHSDFIECLEEKRREDEYERRQDEAFEGRRGKNHGESDSNE